MKVISAQFIKSAVLPKDYPDQPLPEAAFVGRSNVGKSSLINSLVSRKKLAKTSNTPGLTRVINFFRINDRIGFVDLPGYGFARAPLSLKATWRPMVENYLTGRKELRLVVFLLDARREPSEDDLALKRWLKQRQIPALYVLTKIDKLSGNHRSNRQAEVRKALALAAGEDLLPFSARTGEGRDLLWEGIIGHLLPGGNL